MSTGAVVALAMDLCEQGVADYGLRFGDVASYLQVPRLIARREGWGAELALGARDLAALKGRSDLAQHVKGLEMPAYDRRGTFGMGLGYATSNAAPATCAPSPPATTSSAAGRRPIRWRASRRSPSTSRTSALSPGPVCGAPTWPSTRTFSAFDFRHLWGREITHEELMTIGARIWNLGRLLNLREGLSRADDRLPERS